MRPAKARVVMGGLLVAVAASMLVWGFWPVRMQQRSVALASSDLQLFPSTEPTDSTAPMAVISEQLELATEWPSTLRAGDSAHIRMEILPVDPRKSTDHPGEQPDKTQVQAADDQSQTDDYQLVAQGRLEMTGIEYRPLGDLLEALVPGKPVRFIWNIRPGDSGEYSGTLWLHFRYLPKNEGDEERKVIAAQTIDIQSRKFLGLSGNITRIFGSIGLVIGAMIALDFFTLVSNFLFTKKPEVGAEQS